MLETESCGSVPATGTVAAVGGCQAYYEGNLDEEQIVIHNGSGGDSALKFTPLKTY